MKQPLLTTLAVLIGLAASAAWAQGPQYPSLSEYMMPRDAEMALARSAAPASISGRATIKVLTTAGYQVTHDGDNGFVCMVMRGWSAPTYTPAPFRELVYDASVRAPICFDPERRGPFCHITSCEADSGWQARPRTRSSKGFRPLMLEASSRSGGA